jgi:serine protease AprX
MTKHAISRILALLLVPLAAIGGEKTTSRLTAAIAQAPPGSPVAAWVYFVDKGPESLSKPLQQEALVSEKSLSRRMKTLPLNALVDESDRPVSASYAGAVLGSGARLRVASRWLNAVSIDATGEQIATIEKLPFVKSVEPVMKFGRGTPENPVEAPVPSLSGIPAKTDGANALDYGGGLAQVSLENIPAVHNLGYAGQGVLIGSFDNGFRLLSHVAFDTLRPRIVAQHDFVDHKESVAPNNPTMGEHGINTLSTMAGYWPGYFIGPAFRASFVLARTENDSSETPVEEDNWVAAIQWADSIGIDVASTSLGYYAYDPPYTSWTWADLDGKTTAITKAAVWAARKGIVVVNSAGNEGVARSGDPNSLNAPADADSILSVGAVSYLGTRASFSSFGPTADGRIKPDVMAVGTNIHAATGTNTTSYGISIQGTSFSCPLTAGVAAMLLSAKPDATAMEIVAALKMTASSAATPDNYYGWGVIDALAALQRVTDTTRDRFVPEGISLEQNFPNPFNPSTHIRFTLPARSQVSIRVYDLLGRLVSTLLDRTLDASAGTPYEVSWNGTDASGSPASSGVYLYRLTAAGEATTSITKKMLLVR